MDRIQLSENFYLDEFTRSQTAERLGIDMSVEVGSDVFNNLRRLCVVVLQPLRDAMGPVTVSSGYRPPSLNMAIGGATTSQHIAGLAGDVTVTGYTPLDVCRWILDNVTGYDQLIHEFGRWCHVSVAALGDLPRMEDFTSYRDPHLKKTVYMHGLFTLAEAVRRA